MSSLLPNTRCTKLTAFLLQKFAQSLKQETEVLNSPHAEFDIRHGSSQGSSTKSDSCERFFSQPSNPTEEKCDRRSSNQSELYASEFQTSVSEHNESGERRAPQLLQDNGTTVYRPADNDGKASHYCFYCELLIEQLEQHWFAQHGQEYAIQTISLTSNESARAQLIKKLTSFGENHHKSHEVQKFGSNTDETREFHLFVAV